MLVLMLVHGTRHVVIDLGNWVEIEDHAAGGGVHPHFHFVIKFVFDRLSVPFTLLTFLLCGTIGAFAVKYMHRERGYNRFFVLYSVFVFGMVVAALAGTIETLFTGWELVGLSSALLVAFFHERPMPVRNGLRVWVVYRVADAALLIAAVVLHHMAGAGDLDRLTGFREAAAAEPLSWPYLQVHGSVGEGNLFLVVGLLLLVAAAGKSALVPFSGWLPRAMEGPTPSSAVFYGALSVHLGAYLLLRLSPLLAAVPALAAAVVALGLVTAVFAYLTGSVQTDIKSALSFASLAQVGTIVTEIGVIALLVGVRPGLGFLWYVPLVHLLGHACMRTLQFVRAPTLLQDYRVLENAIGARLPQGAGPLGRLVPPGLRTWLYRLAIERGYLDTMLDDYVATPFVRVFRWLDRVERAWAGRLAGRDGPRDDGGPDVPGLAPRAEPAAVAPAVHSPLGPADQRT
jgi:NAD(P)H-quinone oxidoreductase subunit 5